MFSSRQVEEDKWKTQINWETGRAIETEVMDSSVTKAIDSQAGNQGLATSETRNTAIRQVFPTMQKTVVGQVCNMINVAYKLNCGQTTFLFHMSAVVVSTNIDRFL